MAAAIHCCYLLALLVLAVGWMSEGVQNKYRYDSSKRLQRFHEDRPGLIVDQQKKHSLVEEVQVSVKSPTLLSLSLSFSLSL